MPPAGRRARRRVVLGEGHLDRRVCSPALAPISCSSKPGISRAEPSSSSWSRPSPPSNGSPSTVPQVVDHDVVAALRPGARPSRASRSGRAAARAPGRSRVLDRGLASAHLETLVVCRAWRQAGRRSRSRRRAAGPRAGRSPRSSSRLADRRDPGAVDRVGVPAPERAPQRLVEHRLAAEAADHDRRRDLALAEARDRIWRPSCRAASLQRGARPPRREPRPRPGRVIRAAR